MAAAADVQLATGVRPWKTKTRSPCSTTSRRASSPCETRFDLAARLADLERVNGLMEAPGFWDNPEAARTTVAELKQIKAVTEPVQKTLGRCDDCATLLELLAEHDDAEMRGELTDELGRLTEEVERVEMFALLSGPDDARDCFFNIQAGTGGADAQDWASMLLRMSLRYFERQGYDVEQLAMKEGEEAGIQSVNLAVRGAHAYGYLSCEMGVHRLVRISPFSAQGKRETSFSAVHVQPEIEDIQIDIDWDVEVREDTYRSSGAGGQHVNKTSSAVRLTHLATNTVAQCQNERSQHKNRARARRMLMARLYQMEQAKRDAALAAVWGEKGQISWGNAIRSYFLYPERRVKDARSGLVSHDTDGVLDGDIQMYIDAQLRHRVALANK
ncbi:MAG: peptide chain release factor 2 [bacterium]|nr:peptide chain release factor 2 [bacterium]